MLDHDSFHAAQRKVYGGNVCALVRATRASGKVTITAIAEGLPPATLTLQTGPVTKDDSPIAKLPASERGF
jgi:hypothetical protein